LVFFARVRQRNHRLENLQSQPIQLLIPLLNLLVERLILNLQLFVVDDVKPISQHLLLFQEFLLILQPISQSDILQTILVNLLIFGFLGFLPLFYHLGGQLFASTRIDSVHSN